jgi:hypothetical protein
MKRFFRSKLALSIFAVVLLAGAIAVPMVGSITRSHAAAPVAHSVSHSSAVARAAAPTTFSGEGIVAKATTGTMAPVTICDTGPLPSAGTPGVSCGPIAGNFNDPPLVVGSIAIAQASSSTSGSTVTTQASATNTQLLLELISFGVSADLLSSIAEATCTNGRPSVFGDSTILNLDLLGIKVSGHQSPNTPLLGASFPGFTITGTLNEQITTANSITVNALHLHITDNTGFLSPLDLVVASSHADVNCAGVPCTEPPNSDKIERVQDGPKDRNTEPGSGECED